MCHRIGGECSRDFSEVAVLGKCNLNRRSLKEDSGFWRNPYRNRILSGISEIFPVSRKPQETSESDGVS